MDDDYEVEYLSTISTSEITVSVCVIHTSADALVTDTRELMESAIAGIIAQMTGGE